MAAAPLSMTVVLHRGDRQLDADARAAIRAALSIHRMHHARNEACPDKDYGSVLFTFDRLFGTFAGPPREEPLRFGSSDARRAKTRSRMRSVSGESCSPISSTRPA